MDKNIVQPVETMCKTPWKTPCKFRVKKCGLFSKSLIHRAKLHFFTDFSLLTHRVYHTLSTPGQTVRFPHFHRPYYYYYLLFK